MRRGLLPDTVSLLHC